MFSHLSYGVLAVCCVLGNGAQPAHGAPVEGDEDLLHYLIAVQETNRTLFPKGQLTAKVKAVWGIGRPQVQTTEAMAEVVWDDNKTFWDYRIVAKQGDKTRDVSAQIIGKGDNLFFYFPDKRFAQKTYDQVVSVERELELRPDQIWFRMNESTEWLELLRPNPTQPNVTKFVVKESAEGNVVVERHYQRGGIMRIVGSPRVGGNIIAFEAIPGPPGDSWRKGSYEWAKDSKGRFYLKHFEFKVSGSGDPKKPSRSYSLDVTTFDPDPVIPPDRFEWESLKVPPGITLQERGPDWKKTYRTGSSTEPLEKSSLDDLSKKLGEEGFASRKRR